MLIASWNHRGTVEAVVVLSGGGWVKRRGFLFLTGATLTAPAHQWLVREPEMPEMLGSGLSGQRVSGELVTRLRAMAGELRQMDDVAGGGSVLAMARQLFGWVAGLLDRALYSEHTGRALYIMLAELGQPCVAGRRLMRASTGWRSATTSQVCAPPTPPMTGPLAPISSPTWRTRPSTRGNL